MLATVLQSLMASRHPRRYLGRHRARQLFRIRATTAAAGPARPPS